MENVRIEEGARVHPEAKIGEGSIIEQNTEVCKTAIIGSSCKIHRNILIDDGVVIGNNVKIQDNIMIPSGVIIESGVFIGPSVTFTNDKYPRSITPNGKLKTSSDWEEEKTIIKYGASIGANATILCNITIGEWAMIGAGAVITKDVPSHALVIGNPARIVGWVDKSGCKLIFNKEENGKVILNSEKEGIQYIINTSEYEKMNKTL